MWSYEVVDTVTGERIFPIKVSRVSWASRLNGQVGSGSVTIPTSDPMFERVTPSMWGSLRQGWSRTVVGMWDDVPVWAGVVCGSPSFERASGALTLQFAELGKLLEKRLFFGAGFYSKTRSLTFGPFSRQGMLIAHAQHVCGGGAHAPVSGTNSPWRLPVFFQTGPGSGNWSRTTFQHQMERPWEIMRSITEEEGAPDFHFQPGFWSQGDDGSAPTFFQWVFHVGSPLNRSTHEYQTDAVESPVVDLVESWDVSEQQTGVFTLGEGFGEDRPVGMAAASDSLVMPAMDVAVNAPREAGGLNGLAAGFLSRWRHPLKVETFKVRADRVLAGMHGGPNDGLRPGSRVILRRGAHPVLGAAESVERYVVGMSGDGSNLVTVEVQSL